MPLLFYSATGRLPTTLIQSIAYSPQIKIVGHNILVQGPSGSEAGCPHFSTAFSRSRLPVVGLEESYKK